MKKDNNHGRKTKSKKEGTLDEMLQRRECHTDTARQSWWEKERE